MNLPEPNFNGRPQMGKSPRMNHDSCFDDSAVQVRSLSRPNAKRLGKAQSMRNLVSHHTSPHKRSLVITTSCVSPMRAINETCSSNSTATPTTFTESTIPESETTPEISFKEHSLTLRPPHMHHDSCFDDNIIRDRPLRRPTTNRLNKAQSMRDLVSHQTSPHKKSIVITTSCKSPMKLRDVTATKGACSNDSTATPTTFTSSTILESAMTATPRTPASCSSSHRGQRQSEKHQQHHPKRKVGQEDDDDSFRPTHDFDGLDFDSPSCWEPEDVFFISKPCRVPQFYLSRIPEVKDDVPSSHKKSSKLVEMEQLELAVKRGCELASKGYQSATAAACAFDQNHDGTSRLSTARGNIVHSRTQKDRHDKQRNHAASQDEKNKNEKPDLRAALRRSTSMRSCRTLGGLTKPRHPHVSPKKRATAHVKSAESIQQDAPVKSKSETFTESGMDSFSDLNTWGKSDRKTHDDW